MTTIIKIEESYHDGILILVKDYLKEIEERIETHTNISRRFYVKHVVYGIPQVLIPVVLIFVSQLNVGYEELKIISGSGFLATGILSGIYNFFNFSLLSEKHDNAGNRYNTLKDYIESNMARSDNYKIPADVLLEHMKNEMKNLSTFSPSTSNTCISDCCQNKK